jgi:hypothetical protein
VRLVTLLLRPAQQLLQQLRRDIPVAATSAGGAARARRRGEADTTATGDPQLQQGRGHRTRHDAAPAPRRRWREPASMADRGWGLWGGSTCGVSRRRGYGTRDGGAGGPGHASFTGPRAPGCSAGAAAMQAAVAGALLHESQPGIVIQPAPPKTDTSCWAGCCCRGTLCTDCKQGRPAQGAAGTHRDGRSQKDHTQDPRAVPAHADLALPGQLRRIQLALWLGCYGGL